MSIFAEAEFWVALGFVIILLVFWKVGAFKMVAGLLDKRSATIANELEAAKSLRAEAEALLASYKAKTADVDKEAAKILADAKLEAEHFAAESRIQLTAQIERRGKQAQEKIEQAETQALSEIRGLAADAAAAAAEKLIAARLDEAHSAALIAQSLKVLPGKLN